MVQIKTLFKKIRNLYGSDNKIVISNQKIDLDDPQVKVVVPKLGDKKLLLELAKRNICELKIQNNVENRIDKRVRETDKEYLLLKIKNKLKLKKPPFVIECFDNSNLMGEYPFSSCVVFKNGEPSVEDYKCYKVKSVIGPDDYKTMKEVIYRRYSNSEELPDLIIIDGGKGQLNAAVCVLKNLGVFNKVDICGLAKKKEEFFFFEREKSICLEYNSEELKFLQFIRNEAHNFAIKHHRKARNSDFIK